MDDILILCRAPKLVNQLIVRSYCSGMSGEKLQKIVFGCRKFDFLVPNEYLPPVEIELQIAGLKDVRFAKSPAQSSPKPS
jgi:hypothetical protein